MEEMNNYEKLFFNLRGLGFIISSYPYGNTNDKSQQFVFYNCNEEYPVANFDLHKKYQLDLRYNHNGVPKEKLKKAIKYLQEFDAMDIEDRFDNKKYYIVNKQLCVMMYKHGRLYPRILPYPKSMYDLYERELKDKKYDIEFSVAKLKDMYYLHESFKEGKYFLVEVTEENKKRLDYWESIIFFLYDKVERQYIISNDEDREIRDHNVKLYNYYLEEFKKELVSDCESVLSDKK